MRTLVQLVMSVSLALPSAFASAADIDTLLKSDLQRIANQRIFFGHQSVGDNLLTGVQLLAQDAGVKLKIEKVNDAGLLSPGTLGHSFIGENTQPLSKLRAFEAAMGGKASGIDTAAMKFCYIDFNTQTDARALFAQYQATMGRIRALNPGMNWVHITAPLVVVETGFKANVKRWLGKMPYGLQENKVREAYNGLLRSNYAGKEAFFDLARVESTPDGGPQLQVEWKSERVPSLIPAYSGDGEHLNETGQRAVARQFVAVLAAQAHAIK